MASSEAQTVPEGSQALSQLDEIVGKKYVTLRQLASLLGVTYQTVLRYVREDKLHAVRVGGRYRVYEDELRRFLETGNSEG